ncbi:TIGR02678 family protein [Nocardiopsis exhalans]|uniref:TIGR02678 family protein n=1 Tax=Nocardiopsis exhalans TaxID=163604 RepID=A0ABY5DH71_9ACTN|nr:TIGR02678 family protein [Nocardiopsis exhalans]USY22466.1 TIGR02678 family protein [Nocardiopsis exhalans]
MSGHVPVRNANRGVSQARDEMALGIQAMLASPLLVRERDEAAFTAVRRRRTELTAWFDYFCGWTLTVEPRQGYARLAKVRAADSHVAVPRPALRVRGSGAPFDRRRYTLFFLVAAELTVLSRTTVGLLAQRVAHTCAVEEGVPEFDSSVRAERAALVDALLLLEDYGALTSVDGSTESYIAGADAMVLYKADPARLARLLNAPVPPSRLGGAHPDLSELLAEERYGPRVDGAGTDGPEPGGGPNTAGGPGGGQDPGEGRDSGSGPTRNQRLLLARHSLMRRLLDDPVVYTADLSAGEAEYANTLTGRGLLRRAAREAGFRLEERAEGYLLVDVRGRTTDDVFPGEGNVKQTALLLLDVLLAAAEPLSLTSLTGEVEGLLERKPSWARSYRGEGGASQLTAAALGVLVGHGLARQEQGPERERGPADGPRYRALPAAHRYAVDRADFGQAGSGETGSGQKEQSQEGGQA